jgi:hypothetical protein
MNQWARVITFGVILHVSSACSVSAQGVVSSFSECVDAGNKVLRTYPARCISSDGKVFVDHQSLKPPLIPDAEPKKLCKDTCGDGQCAEMVCMAEGCPCAESASSCPKDCK